MVKISQALSASGVIEYHREQYVSHYERYYSESGEAKGVWFGKEAAAFGLEPGSAVAEEHFVRLANGQDPHSGLQLVEWHRKSEAEPRWAHDDRAWRAHLEALVTAALEDGRDIEREQAGGSKLATSEVTPPPAAPVHHSEREGVLLEMHRIARDTFRASLESEAGAGARMYLKERGIRLDTAKEFGVGLADASGQQLVERLRHYGPEWMEASGLFVRRGNEFLDRFRGRLMFPIENAAGETIAFAGRKPPSESGAKYINSPETALYQKGHELYNVARASEQIAKTGRVVVVEGYLDAIAAYQAGVRNVVAAAGTALSGEQAAALAQRAKSAILNFDGDEPGRAASGKHITALLDAGLNVRALELAGDPADWIRQNGAKEYRQQIRDVAPLVSYLADQARNKFDPTDVYGRLDGIKWMIRQLEHVQPEHRAQIAAELERYLQVPQLKPADVEKEKQPVEHRAAWDITFSAPKTVSLTALVGGDDRVRKLHEEAVWEGIEYFERAIQVKMGGLNAPQNTGRMVAALFRHDTARPVDGYAAPQLHTHSVVFNLSQDRDGQYRALSPKELFYLQGAAEAVYQNRLAVGLKALGYELEYGKNLAIEIKGYTEEYRRAESPRRAEIQARKDELGQYGPQADQNIALSRRAAKLDLTADQVRAMHLSRAEQFGNQPQQVVQSARGRERVTYSPPYRTEVAGDAVQFAKQRLSERTSVMEWHEIHRDALRFGRGYITLPDVEQAFARVKERGEFKRVEHWRAYAPESRYTTPELEEKEREILSWMAAGRGRLGAVAGHITRDEFREQFRDHLNDGQKWLVWNVIHSGDRMIGVQGLAGTGKTRALATVRDFADRYGSEVRGAAATTTAVAELRAVGIEANTLAAFSLSKEKPLQPRLYLLDEASLTDVHQMSHFLRELTPADRIVVIGDTRQHGSLGAGRVFAELQEAGMQTFELRKIVRQRSQSYREIVEHLSQGQIDEVLEKLENEARIHEFSDESIRHRAIAAWYMRDPEHTLVVSPDNRSREMISDAVRAARTEAGQLGKDVYRARVLDAHSGVTKEDLRFAGSYRVGDVVVYARASKIGLQKGDQASILQIDLDKNAVTVMRESDGKTFHYDPRRTASTATIYEPRYREFAVGDRVQFTRALGREKIANRTLGRIEAVDTAGNVVLELDGGRRWRGDLERMPHLSYGYVMTSYAAQGATAERVLVHLDTDAPGAGRMVNQQLIYVAASRGREEMQVFVNSREDLAQALLRRAEKASALSPEVIGRYRAISM